MTTVTETASGMLTGGILAIVLEFYVSRDSDARLREAIKETAPVLRDAVIEGLAATPENLTRVASPATLDAIVQNCLTARVGDAHVAADLHAGLRWQISQATGQPYRNDAHVVVNLRPWREGPRTGPGSLFEVTTRWAYRLNALLPVMRFAAVSDHDRYRELVSERASIETWLIDPDPDSGVITRDEFELLQCSINGKRQRIDHNDSDGHQIFTITPDYPTSPPGEHIHVSHTHRTLVTQHGHRLFIDFPVCRGLRLDFTHSNDSDIRHLDVLDYTAGNRPRIEHSPPRTPPAVSLDYGDHLTTPRSGVVLTWTLHREVGTTPETP